MSIISSIKSTVSKVVNNYKTVQSELKANSAKSGYTNEVVIKQVLPTAAKQAVVATGIGTAAKIPAVVSSVVAGVSKAVSSIGGSAKSTIAANPIKSTIAATYGAGVIVTSKKPAELISKAPEAIFEAGTATGNAIDSKSINPIIDYAKEHPVASSIAGIGAAYLVGKGAAGALVTSKLLDTDSSQPIQSTMPVEAATTAAMLPTKSTGTQAQPITPETQVIGKSAGRSITKHKAKHHKHPIQSMKINIINQSKIVRNAKFIY